MRFFRIPDENLYENIRLTLDKVLDLPSEDTLTLTCISPANIAPRDYQNRILLAVEDVFCIYEQVSNILSELLTSELIDEITHEEYLLTIKIKYI